MASSDRLECSASLELFPGDIPIFIGGQHGHVAGQGGQKGVPKPQAVGGNSLQAACRFRRPTRKPPRYALCRTARPIRPGLDRESPRPPPRLAPCRAVRPRRRARRASVDCRVPGASLSFDIVRTLPCWTQDTERGSRRSERAEARRAVSLARGSMPRRRTRSGRCSMCPQGPFCLVGTISMWAFLPANSRNVPRLGAEAFLVVPARRGTTLPSTIRRICVVGWGAAADEETDKIAIDRKRLADEFSGGVVVADVGVGQALALEAGDGLLVGEHPFGRFAAEGLPFDLPLVVAVLEILEDDIGSRGRAFSCRRTRADEGSDLPEKTSVAPASTAFFPPPTSPRKCRSWAPRTRSRSRAASAAFARGRLVVLHDGLRRDSWGISSADLPERSEIVAEEDGRRACRLRPLCPARRAC